MLNTDRSSTRTDTPAIIVHFYFWRICGDWKACALPASQACTDTAGGHPHIQKKIARRNSSVITLEADDHKHKQGRMIPWHIYRASGNPATNSASTTRMDQGLLGPSHIADALQLCPRDHQDLRFIPCVQHHEALHCVCPQSPPALCLEVAILLSNRTQLYRATHAPGGQPPGACSPPCHLPVACTT